MPLGTPYLFQEVYDIVLDQKDFQQILNIVVAKYTLLSVHPEGYFPEEQGHSNIYMMQLP